MFIRTTKTIVALAIVTVSFAFRVAPTNFSGTWKLNESKSELGQWGARAAASKIVIEQTEQEVALTTTMTGFDGGEMTNTDKYAEGKEVEATFGAMKRKGSLKWSDDQKSFTISYTLSGEFGGQSFEMKGSEAWALSEDGKTLTMTTTLITPQGEISTKAAYDKQ